MSISVITPAIPERLDMLRECMDSVRWQTLQPLEHIVVMDYAHQGCVPTLNKAALMAEGDYLALLADDDLFYPHHLELLHRFAAKKDADIVYSFCDVEGRGGWNPNRTFDADALRQGNYIPATTLIRTGLAMKIGYWRDDSHLEAEDWDFWIRALDEGARFHCVPVSTWKYRFHGDNHSDKILKERVAK